METNWLTAREMGEVLGGAGFAPLSNMDLAELVKQGMPGPVEGMYNLDTSGYWYVGHLRSDLHAKGIFLPEDFPMEPFPCRRFVGKRAGRGK